MGIKIKEVLLGNLPLLAFVLFTLIGFIAIKDTQESADHRIYVAQQAICQNSNKFRAQVNRQNGGFVEHNDITLLLFIKLVKLSPEEQVKNAFRGAVPTYRHITRLYTEIPIIDCKKAYPKP